MVLAQPVYGPDRKLIGLLNAGMDLVALTGTLSESRIGSSGYAFILDRDGMVLAHPDQNLLMKNDLAGTAFGRDILAVAGQGLVRFRDAQARQQAAGAGDGPGQRLALRGRGSVPGHARPPLDGHQDEPAGGRVFHRGRHRGHRLHGPG